MNNILTKTTMLTWTLAALVALLGSAAAPSAEPSTTYQEDDQELFSKSFDIGSSGEVPATKSRCGRSRKFAVPAAPTMRAGS